MSDVPVTGFAPETDLERAVSADPVLQEGLAWGRPRRGHPEGAVGEHVADLLETIERWGETGKRREELRFLALVHDSLKFKVSDWREGVRPSVFRSGLMVSRGVGPRSGS